MIHVVTGDNQHLYGPQLDEMFRLRHEYFIEAHGWDALESINGREVDEFDDGDVVYLLNLDQDGKVLSAYRLNPSLGPNLLADKLHSYVDGTPPKSEFVWDLSRWIITKSHRRSSNYEAAIKIARETMIGVQEFCVSRDIHMLTTVVEVPHLERLSRIDMEFSALGPKVQYDGGKGTAQAVTLHVGPIALARVRAATGIYDRLLFEVKPRPVYMDSKTMVSEAELELASAQMRLIGKLSAQKIIESLTYEMQSRAKTNPASAITLIHEFNQILNERLTQETARALQKSRSGTVSNDIIQTSRKVAS